VSDPRADDKPSALEQHNVRSLTLDTATQGIIAAGINVFIAVFLVRLGAPNTIVGFIASAPALGAIFLSIPAGTFLEGRRDLVRVVNLNRLVIRAAYLAIAIVPLVLSGDAEIWAIVVLWTLTSIPAAVANPAWTAVVARIIPPRRRPRVNGNRWAILSVVTAAGGAAFGWLLDVVPSPLNFQLVFVASFVAGLVSIYFFGQIRLPDDAPDPGPTRLPPRPAPLRPGDLVAAWRRYPSFSRFMLTSFVYRIGLNLPVALYSIYAVREAHASNTIIGLQSTAGNLALVGSYLLWGRLAARRGHRIVLLVATAGLSLYPFATALVREAIWLIPVTVIWGIFASGIDVSFFEALLHSCPSDRLQTFVAINSALANVVIFLAPIGGTLLADVIGIRLALITAAVVSLLGSILFYAMAVAKEEVAQPGVAAPTLGM
jgi:MFS family permease